MDIVLIRVGNRNCLVDLGRENYPADCWMKVAKKDAV